MYILLISIIYELSASSTGTLLGKIYFLNIYFRKVFLENIYFWILINPGNVENITLPARLCLSGYCYFVVTLICS